MPSWVQGWGLPRGTPILGLAHSPDSGHPELGVSDLGCTEAAPCLVGCAAQRNFCEAAVCQHGGTCVNRWSTYLCHCPLHFGGKNCEQGEAPPPLAPTRPALHRAELRCGWGAAGGAVSAE